MPSLECGPAQGSSLVAPTSGPAAAADPTPSARCNRRRAHQAELAAAHHRARAAPDGLPRGRRVGRSAARDASQDTSSHGPRRGPRPSASPAVARPTSVAPGGPVSGGNGSRSRAARSDRSAALSWSASHRCRCVARSPDRHRRGSEPSTAQATSNSGARWWRQERSARSQALARMTGSWRSILASRISPTTSG